jgi:putative flippase GtrA
VSLGVDRRRGIAAVSRGVQSVLSLGAIAGHGLRRVPGRSQGAPNLRRQAVRVLRRLRRHLARLWRYASVSVVATGTSLTLLGLLVGVLGLPAGWANVVATAAGTVPSFELNRRWVWRRSGLPSLLAEVVPFAALSFAGLALSTCTVHVAGAWAAGRGWPALARTAVVMVANVGAYGTLWVLQFVILDRILFRSDQAPESSTSAEVDALGCQHLPDRAVESALRESAGPDSCGDGRHDLVDASVHVGRG